MGHHMIEAHRHAKTAFRSGIIEGWIGGPLDQRWSGLALLAFDIEAGDAQIEQAYAQFNSSWSSRFVSARFGQLLPMAILFNGGGAAMPLSAPMVPAMPSQTRNSWTPATPLRGLEIGAVNLPKWNAYVGAGQPQFETTGREGQTDLYASAECLCSEQGDGTSAFGYRGAIPSSAGETLVSFERAAFFAKIYPPKTRGGWDCCGEVTAPRANHADQNGPVLAR